MGFGFDALTLNHNTVDAALRWFAGLVCGLAVLFPLIFIILYLRTFVVWPSLKEPLWWRRRLRCRRKALFRLQMYDRITFMNSPQEWTITSGSIVRSPLGGLELRVVAVQTPVPPADLRHEGVLRD